MLHFPKHHLWGNGRRCVWQPFRTCFDVADRCEKSHVKIRKDCKSNNGYKLCASSVWIKTNGRSCIDIPIDAQPPSFRENIQSTTYLHIFSDLCCNDNKSGLRRCSAALAGSFSMFLYHLQAPKKLCVPSVVWKIARWISKWYMAQIMYTDLQAGVCGVSLAVFWRPVHSSTMLEVCKVSERASCAFSQNIWTASVSVSLRAPRKEKVQLLGESLKRQFLWLFTQIHRYQLFRLTRIYRSFLSNQILKSTVWQQIKWMHINPFSKCSWSEVWCLSFTFIVQGKLSQIDSNMSLFVG